MRVIFLGSGSFACPIAAALRDAGWLVAAVTQPDRPSGRQLQLTACPVKQLLADSGVPVLTPVKIGEAQAELAAFQPDVLAVADYGQYIPSRITRLAPHQAVNVHPSLLPKYRGAAPIPWAIANGDAGTGVTIQYVAPQMDAGDVLARETFAIGPDETAPELEARLSGEGARMLVATLEALVAGRLRGEPQDHAAATHARKMTKDDSQLDWTQPAAVLARRFRAFQPWPGQATRTPRGLLKVWQARVETGTGAPGTVLDVGREGPLVATGEGALRLLVVQPEGKPRMAAADYARGARLAVGETFAASG